MTSEERELLKRMDAGELDGMVGDMFQTDGGSTVWTIIKNGIPVRFKQGPGGKFFNGKENECPLAHCVESYMERWRASFLPLPA